MLGTTMHSFAVGGNCRVLGAGGQLLAAFDNRATAVHVSADPGLARATEQLAENAYAAVLHQLLRGATAPTP